MKKTYQRGTSLNAVILDKLVEVFRALNWKVKNENRFTLFCKALSRLESEEQLLIIELTRDFLHCDLSQYPSAIKQVIDKTVYVMPQNIQEVIAVPLVKPKNVGKVKSGSFLIYLLDQELNQFARAKIPKFSSVDRCSVL